MPVTQRLLEERVKAVEDLLGLAGLSSTPTFEGIADLIWPVNSIAISTSDEAPFAYGTWAVLDSGNLLGGTVGTVYAWKRTA